MFAAEGNPEHDGGTRPAHAADHPQRFRVADPEERFSGHAAGQRSRQQRRLEQVAPLAQN